MPRTQGADEVLAISQHVWNLLRPRFPLRAFRDEERIVDHNADHPFFVVEDL